MTTRTFTVTVVNVSGYNKYFIDGVQQPTLTLAEGGTYVFDWSAATGHPVRFSTTSNGTHSGGTEYTTGVTKDDGNYLTNEDGTLKLFHAPDKDFSHVVEYVELKDLEEVIEQLDETREKNDKQIDHEKKVFGGC